MSPHDALLYLRAEPFRPFRIRTTGGQTFEVCHPRTVRVGVDPLLVTRYASGSPDV